MFISDVNDTGDKLFGGINDTADKFIKIRNGPNGTLMGRGTLIYNKN
jgi:hypothetical protein